jgi:hypothetical protein
MMFWMNKLIKFVKSHKLCWIINDFMALTD